MACETYIMAEGDLRHFISEVLRRHERATQQMVAGLDRTTRVVGARLEEQRLALVDMRAEIADQRKQIQVNTQAVLSVLDRLN
jgi:hypothetical protein